MGLRPQADKNPLCPCSKHLKSHADRVYKLCYGTGYKHIKPMGKVSLYLPLTHAHVDMPTDDWQKYLCKLFQAPHMHTKQALSPETQKQSNTWQQLSKPFKPDPIKTSNYEMKGTSSSYQSHLTRLLNIYCS